MLTRILFFAAVAILGLGVPGFSASGDEPVQAAGAEKPRPDSPSQPGDSEAPGKQTPKTPNSTPPDASKSKPASDAAEPESAPTPSTVRRDSAKLKDADPQELQATVGEDGRVAFEFRNQPWLELVEWLAQISQLPLDWQELPGDRVNLTSPGRYTVEETQDLFNRHLLARGFTLLKLDGGLIIAKTENINPAIVPRVDSARLATLMPHDFVRTSIDVGWLSAEKLAAELKPMISTNGRLTALTTTNRIEAMDAAINLTQIAKLIAQEHDADSRQSLAPEFKLRYLPAEEAKRMLEEFLGVKKEPDPVLTPQQMQMMQQMRNQGGEQPPPPAKEPEISIVANSRQNSVIIRAPFDRIAIADEFIKRVDVPSDSLVSLADVQSRVKVYRLASLDPEKLVEIISEMNVLEPSTRMRVDKDNNALIVSGGGADRFIIESLIERLDGSGRQFEVLQLRRLDATEVAESIAFLMGQKDEDKSESRRPSYYYFGRSDEEESKSKTDEFRVAANSRYRQILLWANDIEMEEVRSLLIKLGEMPPAGGSRQPFRLIDAAATPETYEYLQQLRLQWQRLSPHPLELPERDLFSDPGSSVRPSESKSPAKESDANQPGSGTNRAIEVEVEKEKPTGDVTMGPSPDRNGNGSEYHLARTQVLEQEESGPTIRSAQDFDQHFGQPQRKPVAAEPEPNTSDKQPAPIQVTVDRNGNLVLSSEDTAALDQLENLMLQVTPPQRPYRVFAIENAASYWMKLNLEDYFKDSEEESESDADRFFSWYWGDGDRDKKKKPAGLGAGSKLRFISDDDTNTLVVSGATHEQLRTIEELIRLWDVPAPVNSRKTRYTRLVQVHFGKADKIADTVKDAYRDLLSSNDKAFQKKEAGDRGPGANTATRSRDGDGSGLVDTGNGREGGDADFTFKGKLSIGIDEIGNTLLVSAEGEPLLQLVCDMVTQLDDAARPKGEVEVLQFSGGMSGESLREALRAFGVATESSARQDERPKLREPLE